MKTVQSLADFKSTKPAITNPFQKPLQIPVAGEDIKPRITVMGVGGAGSNAVNNMIRSKLEGVEFIISNTDAQALTQSGAEKRIQLGLGITQGLGAGSRPEVGHAAAEETLDEIVAAIQGTHMLFITAGMGGGTGTGAAPVIAQTAKEMGILTVGVVTKPFQFEGAHRMRTAEVGIAALQDHVDTLIVIPNQNLFRVANEKTTFAEAFKMADEVLYSGVRSVTDLMIIPGLINLDFADIRTVMSEMGKAMMGTGEAEGEGRAIQAAEAAIANPLLDEVSMKGARGVLISITGGQDMTLYEVDEAANRIREEVEVDSNIIFGSTFDERLNGKIRVSVVATGIDQGHISVNIPAPQPIEAFEEEVVAEEEPAYREESFNFDREQNEEFDQPGLYTETMPKHENHYQSLMMEEEDELHVSHQPQRQVPQKQGFFERLTGGILSRMAPQPQAEPQQTQQMKVRKADPVSTLNFDEDDEISEVPAYLRRQGK